MIKGHFQLLNWNVMGAKYFALTETARESFRNQLNDKLASYIDIYSPSVVTLQEIVRYSSTGDKDKAQHLIDHARFSDNYHYRPCWLLDTSLQSAQTKWRKVRNMWSGEPFFAQGIGFLIRKDTLSFQILDIPSIGATQFSSTDEIVEGKLVRDDLTEVVKLESGLYFGNRDTEPRAAHIAHLVLESLGSQKPTALTKPLDIFIINLHLTTLTDEREGVPDIDSAASQKRLSQLDTVINGIISQYNKWRKMGYLMAKEQYPSTAKEDVQRHPPIWVIAGDFNFTPDSVEYQTMIRSGFIDLILNHDIGTKTSLKAIGGMPTLTVDYVFAGPRFEAIDPGHARDHSGQNRVDFNPNEDPLSDHLPLIVSVPISLPE